MRSRRIETGARSSVGTGTTSLLMIFTVLCFATLALLSLSTAYANRSIQQRSVEQTAAQAKAEGEAAAALAMLDAALAQSPEADWPAQAEAQGWQPGENGAYTLQTPMGEEHVLTASIELTPGGGARYRLTGMVASYTGEWTPAGNADIWMGD